MSKDLKELISEIQDSYREEPERAKATFKTVSELQDGFRSEVSIRQHRLTVDEPVFIGGTDQGPTPVEIVLAALGTCQEITWRAFAAALEIDLQKISVKVEGDIDFCGFFAVDESVRPGYERIRAEIKIETNASQEEIEKLREMAEGHCPVLDILQGSVPVTSRLQIGPPED